MFSCLSDAREPDARHDRAPPHSASPRRRDDDLRRRMQGSRCALRVVGHGHERVRPPSRDALRGSHPILPIRQARATIAQSHHRNASMKEYSSSENPKRRGRRTRGERQDQPRRRARFRVRIQQATRIGARRHDAHRLLPRGDRARLLDQPRLRVRRVDGHEDQPDRHARAISTSRATRIAGLAAADGALLCRRRDGRRRSRHREDVPRGGAPQRPGALRRLA